MVCTARSKAHRGVVLLLVLVILATFGITALTFFLSTGQVKDSAIQNSQIGIQTFTPETFLEEAVMQVLRGTPENVFSDIGDHSLLEDMYGSALSEKKDVSFGENVEEDKLQSFGGSSDYLGRVITNVDKDSTSYGKSAVVIKYHQDGQCYVLPQGDGSKLTTGKYKYIVNQRPFQDEGKDYDAPDENNLFLAARDPETGQVKIASYDEESHRTQGDTQGDWEVDADNDGLKDSLWLDLGIPPQATSDGRLFKPMFGIVVEDMDGRLNVNAHGDTYSRDTLNGEFMGLGRGPAEIDLRVLESLGVKDVSNIIESRQGESRYATSRQKGFWYGTYSVGWLKNENGGYPKVQGTPYDIRGIISLTLNSSGHPQYKDHEGNDLPMIFSQVPGPGEENGTPISYDLDLGASRISGKHDKKNGDCPYSPAELERILCPYESHTLDLPDRLWKSLGGEIKSGTPLNSSVQKNLLNIVTTESWDIPVIPKLNVSTKETDNYLSEILAGFPIDLLRAATFNEVNDPCVNGRYEKREAFARCLYNILNQLGIDMGGGGSNKEENNAQWAINVVDFLDADSIMTPFEYQTGRFVYGCERPELLISETLALHSRNTAPDVKLDTVHAGGELKEGSNPPESDVVYENYTLEGIIDENGSESWDDIKEKCKGRDDYEEIERNINSIVSKIEDMPEESRPNGEIDFDQNLRPQGALYVELYHPWGNTGKTEPYCSDLYNESGKVELGKLTKAEEPVWRIVVDKKSNWYAVDPDGESGGNAGMDVERVINLGGSKSRGGLEDVENLYVYSVSVNESLRPGGHAIIGPEGTTVLSFQEGSEEDPTPQIARKFHLGSDFATIDSKKLASNSESLALLPVKPIENKIRLSLTETGNYDFTENDLKEIHGGGDESELLLYSNPYDQPLDTSSDVDEGDGTLDLMKNDRHANYRVLHLQRLANPTCNYNENTNPYITVDSMPVDLMVFNARTTKLEDTLEEIDDEQFDLVSRKRGQNFYSTANIPSLAMLWSQELVYSQNSSEVTTSVVTAPWTQLGLGSDSGSGSSSGSSSGSEVIQGEFKKDLSHAFGKLGGGDTPAEEIPFVTGENGMPALKIPWLTWLNRPPVSPLELLNVPNCKSSMLLRKIHIPAASEGGESGGTGGTDGGATGNYFSNTTGLQGHLPNFSENSGERKKIFGYLRVPSPQTVTPMVLNKENLDTSEPGTETGTGSAPSDPYPFAFYSMYREPGKINLNTIYSPHVLAGLLSSDATSSSSLWTSFLAARGSDDSEPWRVKNPFRPIGKLHEQSILKETNEKYGLFGKEPSGENDPQYHPYLRYVDYYRLANLTTIRSNVFAVWITMGLFECNANGDVDRNDNGDVVHELGTDTGDVKRYRAFYLIDRSIPVGFERGENHNVDRTILLRRYLQ